jgi:hypothetical protein
LLLAAGRHDRHDRQMLGLEQRWAVGARRLRKPGRRCQRSLPTEIHHCGSCACPACPHAALRVQRWERTSSRSTWGLGGQP